MKVVLFCGGLGTRLRDYSDNLPKPLVPIGTQPILWHVMKYYAHFGHTDFILCLGYKAEKIKDFFLNYNEYISNDFMMTNGGQDLRLLMRSDIQDWKITFVETGLRSNIGERLLQVKEHLEGEEMFLANYSDGLTDADLPSIIESFVHSGKVATFMCCSPSQTFHVVDLKDNGLVRRLEYVRDTGLLINGGYFIFRKEIFDYMRGGEELVIEPFQRLIDRDLLTGYRCANLWSMDTFKEQQELTDMFNQGNAPWEVWKKKEDTTHRRSARTAEQGSAESGGRVSAPHGIGST
jgi:glucose-1-phosphate cytidylyltransferase